MKAIRILILLLSLTPSVCAQLSHQDTLYQTLLLKDSLLFQVGFNQCQLSVFEDLIHEEFTFFHDQSGITAGKSNFLVSIKDGLCKSGFKAFRQLIPNTVQVYPLFEDGAIYGAIQTGIHTFYEVESDESLYMTSSARFTHVWLLINGSWKLSEVLSYDHQSPDR